MKEFAIDLFVSTIPYVFKMLLRWGDGSAVQPLGIL